MAAVFVSYRVADSAAHAGRLADSLKARLDPPDVFLSADDLARGLEWRAELQKQLDRSGVVLAVIGPSWSTVRDGDGARRLERDDDVVRLEIRESLSRGTPVVPVLVGGATLPAARDLPPDIGKLLERNAIELRDEHWVADVKALTDALRGLSPALRVRSPGGFLPSLWRTTVVFLVSSLLIVAMHWLLVRLDVLQAASLRLLPGLLAAIYAVLLLLYFVALRRKA
jgi:TIR domain